MAGNNPYPHQPLNVWGQNTRGGMDIEGRRVVMMWRKAHEKVTPETSSSHPHPPFFLIHNSWPSSLHLLSPLFYFFFRGCRYFNFSPTHKNIVEFFLFVNFFFLLYWPTAPSTRWRTKFMYSPLHHPNSVSCIILYATSYRIMSRHVYSAITLLSYFWPNSMIFFFKK